MEESSSPVIPSGPKISAIVVSYNNADGLRRCLTALEASTARAEMQILVVDNGSSDGSGTLDNEFPNATFLRLPRNFGSTKALNIGMRTAIGEYFFYVSPEIEVAVDTAAKLAAYLDGDPDAAAVCPLVLDPAGQFAGELWKLPDPATLKRSLWDPNALRRVQPGQDETAAVDYAGRLTLMARKFFVRGLNYFDERFGEFGADLDLAFQIRRAGRKTVIVPAARVVRHPAPPMPFEAKSILGADRANAISVFLSKHYGFASGLMFRVSAVFGALVRFQLGQVAALAAGGKVDGSQGSL